MTMQGQGESQPGDSEASLSDIGNLFAADDAVQDEQSDEAEDEDADEPEVDETDEADEASDKPEDDPTVVIKHDGKEISLKQSEVLELAQKGFDYTTKTTAVAEERKAIEPIKAEAEKFRQENEQALAETVDRLSAYKTFMESQIGTPPPIEWASTDAGYYLAQKELYESRKGQLQQANAEIQRAQDEQARQRQAWVNQQAESTEKALRDTLPGWNDAMLKDLTEYAGSLGLNPQNTNIAFLQKGFWELAHKAKAFDALQAEKAKLKPIKEMPKVAKPNASNPVSSTARVSQSRTEAYQKRPSLTTLGALFGD